MNCKRASVPVMLTMAVEPAGVLMIKSFAFHNIDAGTLNTFCPAFDPVRMMVPY